MTDRLRISFRPTKLFLVCAFVLYFCPANISGSYFIPKELVGTWFRPDDPSIPGHLVVTTNSVGGRSLALQPWQYLKLTWDINVFSGPGETKECMKCYRLEVLHRNVIRMHVNEEECLNSFASKNVCPDPTSTRLYFRQGGATSLKDCPLFLTQHQVHPALATSYIDSYEEIEQSRVYFQEAGILEQSRPSLDLCLRKFDSEDRADPYFRFLLSDCVFNGNHRSRVEMNYKCLASWKADYASEENDGKVHVFIGSEDEYDSKGRPTSNSDSSADKFRCFLVSTSFGVYGTGPRKFYIQQSPNSTCEGILKAPVYNNPIRTFRGKTQSLYSKLQTAFSPTGMFEVDPFVKKKWSNEDGTLKVDFDLVSKRHIQATVTTASGEANTYFLYEVETSYDTRFVGSFLTKDGCSSSSYCFQFEFDPDQTSTLTIMGPANHRERCGHQPNLPIIIRETGLRPTKSKLERLLEEERLKLEEQLDRSMASITAKLEMHMAEESRCDW